jgi:predicted small secreted protein
MKKSLLVSLILLSGILLTACGNDKDVNDTAKDLPLTDCQKAVNKYLDGADKNGK